jgi:hypothetical protein
LSKGSSCGDQLDKAGQSILSLLHKTAGVAEENSRHALNTLRSVRTSFRTATDRIPELDAEVEAYRDRAERAEAISNIYGGEGHFPLAQMALIEIVLTALFLTVIVSVTSPSGTRPASTNTVSGRGAGAHSCSRCQSL